MGLTLCGFSLAAVGVGMESSMMGFRNVRRGNGDWVPRTKRSGSRSGLGLKRVCALGVLGAVLRHIKAE